MMTIVCKGCGRSFPYQPRKAFHSEQCRKDFHHTEKCRKDQELWSTAQEYDYPAALRKLDPEIRMKLILEALESQGVAYYRVGIPINTPARSTVIRWFPNDGNTRKYLAVHPFEWPKDVPYSGQYLVALFDADKQLLGQPAWKLPLRVFDPRVLWSSGSYTP